MSQVLASVEVGMAFEIEGGQYIKTEEISNNCYKCPTLSGGEARFWSGSRLVEVL